jgi:hypothetical protein
MSMSAICLLVVRAVMVRSWNSIRASGIVAKIPFALVPLPGVALIDATIPYAAQPGLNRPPNLWPADPWRKRVSKEVSPLRKGCCSRHHSAPAPRLRRAAVGELAAMQSGAHCTSRHPFIPLCGIH